MNPIIFTNCADERMRFVLTNYRQIERFFDNRDPSDWICCRASDREIRRWQR